MFGSVQSSLPGIQTATFSLCSHMIANFGISPYKGTDPMIAVTSSLLYLTLTITQGLHLQISSYGELGFQHMNLEQGQIFSPKQTSQSSGSFSVFKCILKQGLRDDHKFQKISFFREILNHVVYVCMLSHVQLFNPMDGLSIPSRLLCPQDFLGKNTGMGCHFLLQEIFLIQGSNWLLLHLLY